MALYKKRAALVADIRAMISQVEKSCRRWRFDPENIDTRLLEAGKPERSQYGAAMAAAGLYQSAELLGEALDLAVKPKAAGGGVLVRTACEFWLMGVYALVGGNDAMLGIETSRATHELTMAREQKLEKAAIAKLLGDIEVLDETRKKLMGDDSKLSSLALDQIARRVEPLIEPLTGEKVAKGEILDVYNLVYRSHSTYDVHPPKIIGALLADGHDGVRIRPIEPWADLYTTVATMAMHVGILGRWIDKAKATPTRDGASSSRH